MLVSGLAPPLEDFEGSKVQWTMSAF